ncbi:class I SAM-dependent methyltransferase [Methylophaga sp.]|uniref:class I SAM-dependent methyltransferase n=1 Tax=Methylophaga sp. TaxID=2024840 RepID=UPI00272035CF|nr:methyltransferase [Methylophaga sp.]MDO8825852.1 methyltransferase [Methylophaga sp.]
MSIKRLFSKMLLISILPLSQTALADDLLQATIDSPHRAESNKQRDQYRHPAETLNFFGVTESMRIVEIWPGRGWYTEILAPWVKQGDGELIAAGFSANTSSAYRQTIRQEYNAWLAASPDLYDEVVITEFGPETDWQFAEPASVDAVLTFRNVHNWVQGEFADEAFSAIFTALKSGGVLGVTDHRAKSGTPLEMMKKSGYLTEDLVISLAENAGFVLEEKSEINANSADTTDHPNGVWTLPPNLRVDNEADKAKYQAIGESDRMTLRFRKP